MATPSVRLALHRIRRHRRDQPDGILLEGPHLVQAGIEAGLAVDELFVTPEFLESASKIYLWLQEPVCPVTRIPSDRLAAVTDADAPRGVLALAHLPRPRGRQLLEQHQLHKTTPSLPWLYLDGVQDPGNLGAIARAAEAFGAPGLLLSPGCSHPNHSRALRGSAGSLLRLPVGLETTLADLLECFGNSNDWAGLIARGGRPIPNMKLRPPLLAVGSEGRGLTPELEARLGHRWTIPIQAPVESLNVAVAVGICLYELADPSRAARSLRTTMGNIS